MRDDTCLELKGSRESLLRAWDELQKLRKIIEVFALEPVRPPAARSFSEEGEILTESLVRILTGLNRDLEGLLRATCAETNAKAVDLELQSDELAEVARIVSDGVAGARATPDYLKRVEM